MLAASRGKPQTPKRKRVVVIFKVLNFLAEEQSLPWMNTWPFGPGYSEGWISVALKFLLIAAILGGIALFLRILFGPGGPLRDKEFDEPEDGGSQNASGRRKKDD